MRLLSYNIHKGIGGRDRRYQLERVIDVIESENPDMICLQEVDRNVRRSRFHRQAQLLKKHFNMSSSQYQVNVRLKRGGYGNLILARWPFLTQHKVSLRWKQRKPRGAQLVTIDTPEGHLHLVNWHLGLSERERHWQVNHLLEHRLFQESAHLPTMITGDFNDWRNTLMNGNGGFARNGFEQITRPVSRFRSFPAYLAMGSLDKAFFRGEFDIRHARVVHSKMAREASDHLPLVVDFHIKTA